MSLAVERTLQPETGPRVWRGADEIGRKDWIVKFTEPECAELARATERASRSGRVLDDLTRADFPLPTLTARFSSLARELAVGRGFVLLRGAPISRMTESDIGLMYWGIGTHLGIGVSQSAEGDRLGHVIDRGTGDKDRYYTRGGPLEFHMDPVDAVGLLCLRSAKSGGASRIVNALAVHNAMLDARPDLLALLYRGFYVSRRGHGQSVTPNRVPVFARGDSGLECYLLPITIRQAIEEGHPLTGAEQEALDLLAELADHADLRLDMDFREGDIQFLSNRHILHARTDYEDDPDPAKRRHLLRLWLMMPNWPPRPAAMNFIETTDRSGGGVKPRAIA